MKLGIILFLSIFIISFPNSHSLGETQDTIDKYALLVGISDYPNIADLFYPDEDVYDWSQTLVHEGFHLNILGDKNRQNFIRYNGLATEKNVRESINETLQRCDDNDVFVFIYAGHGKKLDNHSALSLYDADLDSNETTSDGFYTEVEMLEDISNATLGKFLVFLDCCNSGNFSTLLNADIGIDTLVLTGSTIDGSSYDYSAKKNGLFTYFFLSAFFIMGNDSFTPIEQVFEECFENMPIGMLNETDYPQIFDGDPSKAFRLCGFDLHDTNDNNLADEWENLFDTSSEHSDYDNDGLENRDEMLFGTNPYILDTDGDGLNDFAEIYYYDTCPINEDSDQDGINDNIEIITETDPLDEDTDDDDVSDGDEEIHDTDPTNDDTDEDGLTDGEELWIYNTDPLNPDTDGDGILDGEEINDDYKREAVAELSIYERFNQNQQIIIGVLTSLLILEIGLILYWKRRSKQN